jgi:hypothetical protein
MYNRVRAGAAGNEYEDSSEDRINAADFHIESIAY